MTATNFVNARIDPFVANDPIITYKSITENLTIPASANFPDESPSRYVLFLKEQPYIDLTYPLTISGYTKTTGTPGSGQYKLSYDFSSSTNGMLNAIEFNSANAGASISVAYYGVGTPAGKRNFDEYINYRNFLTSTKTSDFSVGNTDFEMTYIMNPNTVSQYGLLTGTLPAPATNSGKIIKFVHGSNSGLCKIIPNASEKIKYKGNDLTYFLLYNPGNYLELLCDGTDWHVTSRCTGFEIGFWSRSDWTNVHIGNAINYDTKSSAVNLTGMIITEATSNNTAVILYDSGGTSTSGILYVYNITGTGLWTNNRTLTVTYGSSLTVLVNETTGSSKNVDANFYHGFNLPLHAFIIRVFINTTTALWDATSAEINSNPGGSDAMISLYVDANTIKKQTSGAGVSYINDSGTVVTIDIEDYFYSLSLEL